MTPAKCPCPRCARVLRLPEGARFPLRVKCPRCATRFRVSAEGQAVPDTSPEPENPARPGVNLPVLLGLIAAGVLVAGAGAALAVYCFSSGGGGPAVANHTERQQPAQAKASPASAHPPVRLGPAPHQERQPAPPAKSGGRNLSGPKQAHAAVAPKAVKAKRLLAAPRPAPEVPPLKAEKVNGAIDRGVAYLKGCLTGAHDPGPHGECGAVALAGLTLLSCGVPASDPAVVRAVERVRDELPALGKTYDMAVCVWFLDKLNDPQDRKRIQTLALRLIASQGVNGGWNYFSYHLTRAQQKELTSRLQNPSRAGVETDLKAATEGESRSSAGLKAVGRKIGELPIGFGRLSAAGDDWKELPVLRYEPGTPLRLRPGGHEDNSLTQFVILALWAARKHGVPVERSLALAEARFRASQNPDGSWAYTWWGPPGNRPTQVPFINRLRTDSMTCAGLLGLAVGRGLRREPSARGEKLTGPDAPAAPLARDPQVRKGFAFLGKIVGKPPLHEGPASGMNNIVRVNSWGDLYFLWSLERLAVVYSLKRIEGKDWYTWGARLIVGSQHPDGSWKEAFPGLVDTSFALLFLKRVNVAQDLTSKLQRLEPSVLEPDPGAAPAKKTAAPPPKK